MSELSSAVVKHFANDLQMIEQGVAKTSSKQEDVAGRCRCFC